VPDDAANAANAADAEERSDEERAADHAEIERLAADLLPSLIAKLAANGLGEIEVREGPWRLRVRRPVQAGADKGGRSTDRPSRAQPGHAGHGHPPAGFEGHRSSRDARGATAHSTNGSTPAVAGASATGGTEQDAADGGGRREELTSSRAVATSPAVGVYQPHRDAKPGTKVRAGDRLGAVDMLGVAQEVVAPVDGLIGASLAEPGQAVEYGQELVIIERTGEAGPATGRPPAGEA
jgi:biotin carboxyl carrier protein